MYTKAALASLSLLAGVRAQQAGTLTAEVHPSLSYSTCTASGCTSVGGKVVLDSNWRWVHSTSGSTNCYTGNKWDATLCPANDATACTTNCAVDGADYTGTYGITTSGNSLKLGFVTGSNIGSRTYLMDTDTSYKVFKLKGMEFTVDVDVSQLSCGLNGALYFVTMDADGGIAKNPGNKAGAKFGTGYCDAQCPKDLKFINGLANNVGWTGTTTNSGTGAFGSCCSEMDIWEANKISTAYTPHVCATTGPTKCNAAGNCARNTGLCDADGCDFNPYRMGNTSFYGPGKIVDTAKPVSVVTQFITNDGTPTGTLTDIKRFYVQNGKVIPNPVSNVAGVSGNSVTDAFCTAQKSVFGDVNYHGLKGGLVEMGKQLDLGMVLVMSIWDDNDANMLWLDSNYPLTKPATSPGVARGTCDAASGVPAYVEANHPNDSVTFSNIKFGPIGSTFAGGGTGTTPGSSSTTRTSSSTTRAASSSTTTRVSTTTTRVTTTSSAPATGTGAPVAKYGQCGGKDYTGSTNCVAGTTCVYKELYYSQCL